MACNCHNILHVESLIIKMEIMAAALVAKIKCKFNSLGTCSVFNPVKRVASEFRQGNVQNLHPRS